MNRKIIDILFGVIVFSLPFKYVPKTLWQIFWGGPFGQHLVVYPLIVGFIYTGYCSIRDFSLLYHWKAFRNFLLVYIGALIISLIWGAYIFPYYNQVLNGPATQIRQLPIIMTILSNFGIQVDEKKVLELLIILRPLKGIFFDTIYTFGGAYLIYVWYHDRPYQAIRILLNVVTVDLILIAVYGLIDVCYQNGQMWAQNILAFINPLLYNSPSVEWSALDFHPGLFWNGQVRSIFLEPSYFGNFMSFAFPVLCWKISETKERKSIIGLIILFAILTFEIILSKSRTGALILLGEFILYGIVVLMRKDKALLELGLAGIIIIFIAYGAAKLFTNFAQYPVIWMGDRIPLATMKAEGENITKKMASGDTLDSIFDQSKARKEKQESNHSRFTITKTDFLIGKEHLLLGVGNTMRSAYLRDKLSDDPGREIQEWNKRADKNGVLAPDGMYFGGCDYTSKFSETGLLGLLLFCFPGILISWVYLLKVFNRKIPLSEAYPFIFSSISLAGMMASGIGDTLTLTFSPWLVLGISYVLCYGKYVR